MKYYLVARTTCCMVGIEQCRGFIVGRSLRAAFEKEYAGRILMVTSGALALPGIYYTVYKKASGPFYIFIHIQCRISPILVPPPLVGLLP